MKKRKKPIKYPISQENQGLALQTPISENAHRDAETNIYTPTIEQVEEAKDWSEFCKL